MSEQIDALVDSIREQLAEIVAEEIGEVAHPATDEEYLTIESAVYERLAEQFAEIASKL